MNDLRETVQTLNAAAQELQSSDVQAGLLSLEDEVTKVARSWSGSWIGHHANVYYRHLKRPPPGAHFSSEWGLEETLAPGTRGDWVEHDPDKIRDAILKAAGQPDLEAAHSAADTVRAKFTEAKSTALSVLELEVNDSSDSLLAQLLDDVKKMEVLDASEVLRHLRPSGKYTSRDSVAVHQGLWTPPHLALLAEVIAVRSSGTACSDLAALCGKAASHIDRVDQRKSRTSRVGTNVFIGHGRSPIWRDLKDFVQDRLALPWDEFNRVPVAGVTNIARLSQMLGYKAQGIGETNSGSGHPNPTTLQSHPAVTPSTDLLPSQPPGHSARNPTP